MRIFLSVLILIISFQSWTKADVIEDYEIEGWTGNWSADELIQLVCRTSNGQVSEKEVRNLFGEAFNEERND